MPKLSLAALAAASLAPAVAAQQFVYDAAALPAQNIWTDGVELVDVDDDDDIDILFANGSTYGAGGAQAQHLFLNNGAGVFAAAHAQLNVANFNAKMVIAEDFDGDGDPDLMYAPEGAFPAVTQKPRMLINNGAGVFTDESATRIPNINMASFCVCAGDVDGDFDLDVVFTDGATFGGVATQARLYLNNGSGFFTDATAAQMPVDTYNAQDVILLDFDVDYDIDIALSGKGAAGKRARLYLNNGSGTFSVNTVLDAMGGSATYEIDWGELDGDSDLDGLVQSVSGTSEGWAQNNGTGVPVTPFTFPLPNGGDDNEMAGVDYDNDGDLDVFVGSLGSTERAYRNDGGGAFVNVNAIIQAVSDATLDFGFADLDGDNDYDMVTGQGESGNFLDRVYDNTGGPDTRAPRFVRVQQNTPIVNPTTKTHAILQDAIQDDGKAKFYSVFYAYATFANGGGTTGGGAAFHRGTGLWAAALSTPAGTTGGCTQWTAVDDAGNSSGVVAKTGAYSGFVTITGTGAAGTSGVPVISGSGPLTAGSSTTVSLSNAVTGMPGAFVVSGTYAGIPLLGGILVPSPDTLLPYVTTGSGTAAFNFTWPSTVPPCQAIWWQGWTLDAGAAAGFSASDGLRSVQP